MAKKHADNIARTGRNPEEEEDLTGVPGMADSMGDLPDAIEAEDEPDQIHAATGTAVVKHGFTFKNRVRHEFQAWHVPCEGDVIEVELLARQRDPKPLNKGQVAYMYIGRLLSTATVVLNGQKGKQTAEPGTVIAIRERKALEPLADLLDEAKRDGSKLMVQITCLEKTRIQNTGQTFWKMDVGYEFAR